MLKICCGGAQSGLRHRDAHEFLPLEASEEMTADLAPIIVLCFGMVWERPHGRDWETFQAIAREHGLRQARELPRDLIILGSLTPDVARGHSAPGYEIVRRLKAAPATVQAVVVIVTSLREPERKHRAEQAGVDVYIVRPVDPVQLRDRLRELVEQRRA